MSRSWENFGTSENWGPDAWRDHVPMPARQKLVLKMLSQLQLNNPEVGQDELLKIATSMEEQIFKDALDRDYYKRKMESKMTELERGGKLSESEFKGNDENVTEGKENETEGGEEIEPESNEVETETT